jgi:hypothetical protein
MDFFIFYSDIFFLSSKAFSSVTLSM